MKQPMARVVSHEQIAHGIYELTLFTPIADIAEPGQFVHVKIPGGDATLLRRPISIARSEESTLTLGGGRRHGRGAAGKSAAAQPRYRI